MKYIHQLRKCYDNVSWKGQIKPIWQTKTYQHKTLLTYLLTYLLTPWSRVLLEKLIALQLVKKFPAFYGTQKFITEFTSASHLSLSWASLIQSVAHVPLPEDPYYTKKSIKLNLMKTMQNVLLERFTVGAENALSCLFSCPSNSTVPFLPDRCFSLFCWTELVVIFHILGSMLWWNSPEWCFNLFRHPVPNFRNKILIIFPGLSLQQTYLFIFVFTL